MRFEQREEDEDKLFFGRHIYWKIGAAGHTDTLGHPVTAILCSKLGKENLR
jgi:hypothetical protein